VIGALPRKYLPFPDNKFGIRVVEENFYIGGKDNKVVIEGNDLIIDNERYKETHGLWKLLTKPNRKNLDKDTYESWWTNKNNFTEKDLNLYKEILMKTHSVNQNNDPSTKKPKSSIGRKWNDLVSKIWKEIKPTKSGFGLIKYHEGPIEYKYIDNLNQLQQRLYYIYAQEKAGNDNFHNEKMRIINFISKQLEKISTILKG
jgi:hypothetical protein